MSAPTDWTVHTIDPAEQGGNVLENGLGTIILKIWFSHRLSASKIKSKWLLWNLTKHVLAVKFSTPVRVFVTKTAKELSLNYYQATWQYISFNASSSVWRLWHIWIKSQGWKRKSKEMFTFQWHKWSEFLSTFYVALYFSMTVNVT